MNPLMVCESIYKGTTEWKWSYTPSLKVDGSTEGFCWHGYFLKPSGNRPCYYICQQLCSPLSADCESWMEIDLPCVYPHCEEEAPGGPEGSHDSTMLFVHIIHPTLFSLFGTCHKYATQGHLKRGWNLHTCISCTPDYIKMYFLDFFF